MEMKPDYKLLKPLPGIPAGAIYKYSENDGLYHNMDRLLDIPIPLEIICVSDDWFEKMPERIEVGQGQMLNGKFCIAKHDGQIFTTEEIDNINGTLNGERYSIEQIREAINNFNSSAAHAEFIANWVRDEIIKKLND